MFTDHQSEPQSKGKSTNDSWKKVNTSSPARQWLQGEWSCIAFMKLTSWWVRMQVYWENAVQVWLRPSDDKLSVFNQCIRSLVPMTKAFPTPLKPISSHDLGTYSSSRRHLYFMIPLIKCSTTIFRSCHVFLKHRMAVIGFPSVFLSST